jgi:hypothetical protein
MFSLLISFFTALFMRFVADAEIDISDIIQ